MEGGKHLTRELLGPSFIHSAQLSSTYCVPHTVLGLESSNERHKLSVEFTLESLIGESDNNQIILALHREAELC